MRLGAEEGDLLPLDAEALSSVAVIGPLADSARDIIGPWVFDFDLDETVTVLDGIRARAGDAIRVEYARGVPVVDLRWNIRKGAPATINKIEIVGNDVTHERVIREAIVMLPGDLFSRERLIRSYQNVSNLGFFQQPMPSPDVKPSENVLKRSDSFLRPSSVGLLRCSSASIFSFQALGVKPALNRKRADSGKASWKVIMPTTANFTICPN